MCGNHLVQFIDSQRCGNLVSALKTDSLYIFDKAVGILLDDLLEEYLLNSVVVSIALIVYGIAFILVEHFKKGKEYRIESVYDITYRDALAIGAFQCLSLVPGTSRSGSTILGGMLSGVSRAAASEFSFFMAIPVMLGAYAGLRRGEISALTIQDLDGDFISINKDMVLDDNKTWVVKEPKTPSSNRTVLLPAPVADRIRQKGYITHLTPNNITKRFIKRQKALGVEPHYTFHSLRHFFASYLHAQSIPDAYVLRAGGWATPHVMQKVYRHALDDVHLEMSKKAVEAFQNSLQNT